MQNVKCVVVGGRESGRTTLLRSFAASLAVDVPDHVPAASVFDNYPANLTVDGVKTVLGLIDTSGQEDFPSMRALVYPQTDVFILVHHLGRPDSFSFLATDCLPEVQKRTPGVPFVIVGVAEDLRDDEGDKTFSGLKTFQELESASRALGADSYLECSTLTGRGVHTVFEHAARLGNKPKQKRSSTLSAMNAPLSRLSRKFSSSAAPAAAFATNGADDDTEDMPNKPPRQQRLSSLLGRISLF